MTFRTKFFKSDIRQTSVLELDRLLCSTPFDIDDNHFFFFFFFRFLCGGKENPGRVKSKKPPSFFFVLLVVGVLYRTGRIRCQWGEEDDDFWGTRRIEVAEGNFRRKRTVEPWAEANFVVTFWAVPL